MMTVLRLVAGLPRHKNFKLFFDNWFASEELIIELLKMGFHSIATVRTNRFKINFKSEKKVFEKGERGSYDIYIHKLHENFICVRWLDNKPVHLVSIFVGIEPLERISRWHKNEKRNSLVTCPGIVKAYNKSMGGIDLADMFLALYRIDKRSKRYYMRIIYFLIHICILNSFLIWKKNNPFDTMIYREFILSVSKSLIYCEAPLGRPSEKRVAEELDEIKKSKKAIRAAPVTKDVRYVRVNHFPVWVAEKKSDKKKSNRIRCQLCTENKSSGEDSAPKSSVKCSKCNFYFCLNANRN